jgi:hypothetical protein
MIFKALHAALARPKMMRALILRSKVLPKANLCPDDITKDDVIL